MSDILRTDRFGEISFDLSQALMFPEGIPGFEDDHRWIIIGDDDSFIKWLQSCDHGDVALPVIPALQVFPSYRISLDSSDAGKLDSPNLSDVGILLVISVPAGDPAGASVNLRAPILVNKTDRKGFQFIVKNERYGLNTPFSAVMDVIGDGEDAPC